MKKSVLFFVPLFLIFAFVACGEKHSAKFSEMDADIQSLEQQLATTNDCDELQMLYLAILGLRSDLSMPEDEGGLSELEFETVSNKISALEVTLNTKMQQLDCYNNDFNDEVIDTSEEEYPSDYNIL